MQDIPRFVELINFPAIRSDSPWRQIGDLMRGTMPPSYDADNVVTDTLAWLDEQSIPYNVHYRTVENFFAVEENKDAIRFQYVHVYVEISSAHAVLLKMYFPITGNVLSNINDIPQTVNHFINIIEND